MNISNTLITESHLFCGLYINSVLRVNMYTMEITSAEFCVNTHKTKEMYKGKELFKGSYPECVDFIGKYVRERPSFIPTLN